MGNIETTTEAAADVKADSHASLLSTVTGETNAAEIDPKVTEGSSDKSTVVSTVELSEKTIDEDSAFTTTSAPVEKNKSADAAVDTSELVETTTSRADS